MDPPAASDEEQPQSSPVAAAVEQPESSPDVEQPQSSRVEEQPAAAVEQQESSGDEEQQPQLDRVTIASGPFSNNEQRDYTVSLRYETVHVTVTRSPWVIDNWLFGLMNPPDLPLVAGLGVQWINENEMVAATLQLCVGNLCLIIQVQNTEWCPDSLHSFLQDPGVMLVGFGNYRDREMLENTHHGFITGPLVDLREAANVLLGCRAYASAGELASQILGFDRVMLNRVMNRAVGRSNWNARRLSLNQVRYATIYAFLAFLIAVQLQPHLLQFW